MPVKESCLICHRPLKWIPNLLREGEGFYVHEYDSYRTAPHAPVPALDVNENLELADGI